MKENETDDKRMPFTKHLEELRRRFIIIALGIAIGFGCSYAFVDPLILLLQSPLPHFAGKLIFIAPTEAFLVKLKVAFFAGIAVAMPVILYQLWQFIAPGLLSTERKYTLPFVVLSTIYFIVGAEFAFYVVLPFGLRFLLNFGADRWKPAITIASYVTFAGRLLLTFGLVFQLPLTVLLLSQLGLITSDFLIKNRKYSVLIAFVIAAVLTPPDVVSQVLMAIPLLVLYEIGIWISKMVERSKEVTAKREESIEG